MLEFWLEIPYTEKIEFTSRTESKRNLKPILNPKHKLNFFNSIESGPRLGLSTCGYLWTFSPITCGSFLPGELSVYPWAS